MVQVHFRLHMDSILPVAVVLPSTALALSLPFHQKPSAPGVIPLFRLVPVRAVLIVVPGMVLAHVVVTIVICITVTVSVPVVGQCTLTCVICMAAVVINPFVIIMKMI